MLDSYRIDPPQIPAPRSADPSIAGHLEYPVALDRNVEALTRSYCRFLMPVASLVGCGFVGLVSGGDHCWIILLPIAAYLFSEQHHHYWWPFLLCLVGSLFAGRDLLHYLLPLLIASHVARTFSMHYVWYATGAPVALQDAQRIRVQFGQRIRNEKPRLRRRDRLLAYRAALNCWFGYNTANSDGPGVLNTPAGDIDRRVRHTCLAIVALCVLAYRPFLDLPEFTAAMADFRGETLPTTVEQFRAARTSVTLFSILCVFWVPPLLLRSFFRRFQSDLLTSAYLLRIEAELQPPEMRHRRLMERLDMQQQEH